MFINYNLEIFSKNRVDSDYGIKITRKLRKYVSCIFETLTLLVVY